jgi:uncharacterized protein YajQ (UPF0234 family)
MPSFDIVSKVDLQTLDNTVNVTRKELENRFDFKGRTWLLRWTKKSRRSIWKPKATCRCGS